MKRIQVQFIHFILFAAFFASCNIIRHYQQPAVDNGNLYRDVTTSDTTSIGNLNYREIFSDTILQALIAEGISRNLDLQIAYTRIRQAEAYYQQSRLAFLPTLNGNASIGVARIAKTQAGIAGASSPQLQLGLSTGWEADIWGRLGSTRRANFAALLENEAYSRVVKTNLVAGIANYYYTLLSLDQQLIITQQTVELRRTTLETIKALKEGAIVTGAAVVQSEANLYAAQVTIPDLQQNIRETENALSILLARPPAPVVRDSLYSQQPFGSLQTGVPAQLLHNRPDVQQAEFAFRNAFELTNVAYTNFYPSLNITGSGGMAGAGFKNFFNTGAFFGNIAAGLTQPIFNRGLNRTQLIVGQSNQQAALLSFQNIILTAGQEVSNALFLHQAAIDKMNIRVNQLGALQKSVEYTQELLKYGFANYTEVLTAQQSLLSAELSGIDDKLQQLQAIVNLYRALGGGWR